MYIGDSSIVAWNHICTGVYVPSQPDARPLASWETQDRRNLYASVVARSHAAGCDLFFAELGGTAAWWSSIWTQAAQSSSRELASQLGFGGTQSLDELGLSFKSGQITALLASIVSQCATSITLDQRIKSTWLSGVLPPRRLWLGYRDPGASTYTQHTNVIPQVLTDYWRSTVAPATVARWTCAFPAAQGGPDSCTGMTKLGECSAEIGAGNLSTYLPTALQSTRLPDSWGAAQWTDTTRWNKRLLWHSGDMGGASPPYAVVLRTGAAVLFPRVTWITQPLSVLAANPVGSVPPTGRTLLAAANTIFIPEFEENAQRVFLTAAAALQRQIGMIQKGAAPSFHIRWLTIKARVESTNSVCGLPSSDVSYFTSHAPASSSSSRDDVPAPPGGASGDSE